MPSLHNVYLEILAFSLVKRYRISKRIFSCVLCIVILKVLAVYELFNTAQ